MWPIIALSGASALGSYLANSSAEDRAKMLDDQAFQEYLKIKIPDPAQQKLALQKFVSEGKLVPQLEQAIQQNPSEFQKIAVDQNNKVAQNKALSSLEQIGNEGGLRLQDKAALQQAMMQGAVRDRGNRLAISDEMNRKGMGGSGFDLQAQLQGQQAAGDRDAMSGLNIAAQAQDRALKAIQGSGELATKYRGQDFEEQAARARAQDAINEFNARNLQGVQHNNVGYQNRAQEMNLAEQQRIADQNVNLSNKEQQYNKELLQKQFENQMNMANAKSGQYGRQAQSEIRRGENTANLISNIGQAGVGGIAAYGNKGNTQQYGSFDNYNPNYSSQLDDDLRTNRSKNKYNLLSEFK